MHQRSHQFLVAALILLGAVALRIADPEPVARLRLLAFDTYQRLLPRTPDPSKPVVVVDIDEASLAKLGQWPWPRTTLAALVDRIKAAGARTLAIDLILSEPDRLSPEVLAKAYPDAAELSAFAQRSPGSNDQRLATALAGLPVVLGVSAERDRKDAPPPSKVSFATAGDDPKPLLPHYAGATGPLPQLAEAAAALGAVNWVPSGDQVVRRVPLLLTMGDTVYPSLALEQYRLALGAQTLLVRASGASGILAFGQKTGVDSLALGERLIPASGNGEMWLHFAPLDRDRYVPAHQLLEPGFDMARLKDKHVLIGASATGLLDLRATPLDASVPGVEIHAQALEHLLAGTALERPAWALGAELFFMVVAGVLVAWLIGRSSPVAAAVIGLLAIAGVGYGSWHAFGQGLLVDPVYPSLALVGLYLTGSLAKFVATERDRLQIRYAFSHYLAPAIVEELARDPSKLKLGGELRQVTVMFSDVRGFSKMSEGMDAEDLIGFVNSLFTPFSDIIIEHRGTIDKFMGDGVMAFWNAPTDDPKHATNACRAALAVLAKLDELNTERARKGQTQPVAIGIGLNSGPCAAGNVGSPQQLNYSIMGETVNIAARFEEATKSFNVPIIVGEATQQAAEGLAFLDIGQVTPRGKTRSEHVFALVGDETTANSERFLEMRASHARLMAALAAGDREGARTSLAACRKIEFTILGGLLDAYQRALATAG